MPTEQEKASTKKTRRTPEQYIAHLQETAKRVELGQALKRKKRLEDALMTIKVYPGFEKNPHLAQAVKSLEAAIGGMVTK